MHNSAHFRFALASEPLPEDQFFKDDLAVQSPERVRRASAAPSKILPDAVDLLVLNALHGQPDLHCSEIIQRIYDMTAGGISIPHKTVWHSLGRLEKNDRVERRRRDPGAGRRLNSPLYRLTRGGGSHLAATTRQWRDKAAAIHFALTHQ